MIPFTTISGIAAPFPVANVDTDMIIPKQFLRTIKRTGLGIHLFNDSRFDENGNPINDFILNQEPYDKAQILIAGENFGCGSSREHAPWALLDFGIRSIIAPSFADIFFNNCFKNGILPISLPKDQVDELMDAAKNQVPISIDLNKQQISATEEQQFSFEVDSFRKHCLLNGLDDIGLTLEKEELISEYEKEQSNKKSWLFG